ncbi:sigma-70 family RNA polymerase sigma factor [Brevibacterium marinum]|uniref:DNA-directed RNA polymerase specialized sigma24 family protein n=1 Tax=Brevibacterium marinum TaxID=418643 RepID=A0A846RPS5_9MICO|nr:sigma-70 family RNA polymerase sigma factor [Brevibacterium marinum]NJC55739.1 DNA-directed RNA polymerase specialized sigma24 family protein [Brevibacterium marinum]
MDAQGHQPGEELADFTEGELLSLIDAGTAGAYSEIYRRYVDDAVARAASSRTGTGSSGPSAEARYIADDAFLSVLRSLLDGTADTAEGLRSLVDDAIDARLDELDSSGVPSIGNGASVDASAVEADRILAAQALSTLPDNWQRILWLRGVEHLSLKAAADRLHITTATVERLSTRAHQNLQKEWERTRSDKSALTADHRSTLIPALLTSPIVIERLSGTIAHTTPEAAHPPTIGAVPDTTTPAEAVPDEDASAEAAPRDAASAEPVSDDAAEESPSEGTASTAAAVSAGTGETGAPAAASAASNAAPAAAATAAIGTVEAPERSAFTMPKPVLIPVIAACIGLLGTLVGLAIVPQQTEPTNFQPRSSTSNVSTTDKGTDTESRDPQSPDDESSDGRRGEPRSEDSKAADPDSPNETGESARGSEDRTDDSPTGDKDGDDGDSTDDSGAKNPGDPSPPDSDRPDPEAPSDTPPPETPSDPSPSEPDDPEPTPSEPPETEDPSEPPETEDPPEPTEPDEPPPSDTETPEDPSTPPADSDASTSDQSDSDSETDADTQTASDTGADSDSETAN